MRMQIYCPVSRALSPETGIYERIAVYRKEAAGKKAALDVRQGASVRKAAQAYRQHIAQGVVWGMPDSLRQPDCERAVRTRVEQYANFTDKQLETNLAQTHSDIDMWYRTLERGWRA